MAGTLVTRRSVVVMGPSGVGKSTTAKLIAEQLRWSFAEADEFHPKANIEKMSAGIPLTDEDRWPWLAAMRDWMSAEAEGGRDTIVTCSALKRSYRELLRGARAHVRFLELTASQALIEGRMAKREGHFMPVSLLASQFSALEPLEADEDGVEVCVAAGPEAVVAEALAALGLAPRPDVAAGRAS